MKLVRLSAILRNTTSHFAFGNAPAVRSFFTKSAERSTSSSRLRGSMNALYCRISPIGNPRVSIVPLLDLWVQEGRPVVKEQLQSFIKELRTYRRFSHALEMSMWMTDKIHLPLTPADVGIRLDLISKIHGTKEAENYFINVLEQLKDLPVYSALLNCYVSVKSVEKAEATMQKMRDLGFARTSLAYNVLLNLYYQTANYEKLNSLMHEMQEKGIACDKITMGIRLNAFGATSDVEAIDKTLAMMESDPNFVWDWTVYNNAASSYAKAGLLDNALEMLKKSEELILETKCFRAYEFLITQYAKFGKKDDVIRLWELYKKNQKVYNKGYACVISSLLRFDDLESAKKIFDEWESENDYYDIRIVNFLIGAYSSKGLLQDAKNLIDGAKLKGGKPNQTTWLYIAVGYFQNNETQKAVVAMEEALVICKLGWKPRKVNFSACLKYYIGEGDIEGAEKFIKLLRNKDIISVELQDRLLNYVQNRKSNVDELNEFFR
ncbi:pentatricopeptide repeat-containing protein At2g20710, mitochondrial-like [Pistacia vera]|uniref:pentatricopeptide repeat-containing protein At2g20710, mitochondrial-like n=1 Tax=Pistacia vera TaxID=55513 RepID=UPI001263A5A1|nr:pentatricopeptide repeat-containing protein At2g20710, mitochondrial-like [Pistacia vera]